MSGERLSQTPVELVPSVKGQVSAIASANAPFIYFDIVPNCGFHAGIANITLEAVRFTSIGDKVLDDRVVVAHLRMSSAALSALKDAIGKIELLAMQSQEPGQKPN